MVVMTVRSFSPSDVSIHILYNKWGYTLPPSNRDYMLAYTRDQIRYGFAFTVGEFQHRKIFPDGHPEFILVDREYRINEYFFQRLKKKVHLTKDSEWDGPEFRLRLAEEMVAWALREPQGAKETGIVFVNGNLILLRKNEIDSTGSE